MIKFKKKGEKELIIVWMDDDRRIALVKSVKNVSAVKKGDFLGKRVLDDLSFGGEVDSLRSDRDPDACRLFDEYCVVNSFPPKRFLGGVMFGILEPNDATLETMKVLQIKTERELIEKAVGSLTSRAILEGFVDHEVGKTWLAKRLKERKQDDISLKIKNFLDY